MFKDGGSPIEWTAAITGAALAVMIGAKGVSVAVDHFTQADETKTPYSETVPNVRDCFISMKDKGGREWCVMANPAP